MRGLGVVLLLVSVRRVTPDSIPPDPDTATTNSPVMSISSTPLSTTDSSETKKEVRMSNEEVKSGKDIMIKHFGESKVFVLLISIVCILIRSQR